MGIDLMASRRRIILNSPHLATPTPANPVAFSATIAAPLKALECAFSPVQAGSGDPSPSNVRAISGWTGCNVVRCGKNLFDKANANVINGYVSANVIISSAAHRTIYIPCKPNTTYVCSNSANNRKVIYYADELPEVGTTLVLGSSGVVTTGADAQYIVVYCYNGNSDECTFNDVLNALQIELGSTATTYAPYTGQTLAVQFPATKNLLNTNGTIGHNNYNFCGFPNTLKPNTTYTFSISGATTYAYGLFLATSDTVATSTTSKLANYITSGNALTFTTPAAMEEQWLIIAGGASGAGNVSLSDVLPQVELGSTATPYEPYGTIYGGTIDPVRGVARAEWGKVTITKFDGVWGTTTNGYAVYKNMPVAKSNTAVKCNMFKESRWGYDTMPLYSFPSGSGTGNTWTFKLPDTVTSLQEANAWLEAQSDPLVVVYTLATPIDYPLTPAVLKTLKGANVLYTSLNGNVSPIYWTN